MLRMELPSILLSNTKAIPFLPSPCQAESWPGSHLRAESTFCFEQLGTHHRGHVTLEKGDLVLLVLQGPLLPAA